MSVLQVKFRKFSFTWMNNLYAIQLLEVVMSVENTMALLLVSLFAPLFSNLNDMLVNNFQFDALI